MKLRSTSYEYDVPLPVDRRRYYCVVKKYEGNTTESNWRCRNTVGWILSVVLYVLEPVTYQYLYGRLDPHVPPCGTI